MSIKMRTNIYDPNHPRKTSRSQVNCISLWNWRIGEVAALQAHKWQEYPE